MTFTEFLTRRPNKTVAPSFLNLARHDALWPSQSSRLEDFESFLLARLEDESEEVIPELRKVWKAYAREEPAGKHDQDLALSAWGDFARHLASCSGSRMAPCEAAEELLEQALEESQFEDLHHPHRAVTECEGGSLGEDEAPAGYGREDDDDLDATDSEEDLASDSA